MELAAAITLAKLGVRSAPEVRSVSVLYGGVESAPVNTETIPSGVFVIDGDNESNVVPSIELGGKTRPAGYPELPTT